jgi:hypothetical protein
MRGSPFEIKALEEKDVETCAEMLRSASALEFSPDLPKPDWECVRKMFLSLQKQNCLIGYLNNGQICGFLGVELDKYWWSNELVLMDVMFYIKPEFRSYTAFKRMLSVAEEFAKLNNVPIALSFFSDKDLAKKAKMIMRRGYKAVSWTMFRSKTK